MSMVATYRTMAAVKRRSEFVSGQQQQYLENEKDMEEQVY